MQLKATRLTAIAHAVKRAIKTFSVRDLFAGGALGVWYDPSDVKLDWRYNLLTKTEEFNSVTWLKTAASVTADSTTAPNGTLTADTLIESTGGGEHFASQQIVKTATNTTYTKTAYFKNAVGTRNFAIAITNGTTGGYGAIFSTAGAVVNASLAIGNTQGWTFVASSVNPVGDGWYQASLTATSDTSTRLDGVCYLVSGTTTIYTGNGTSGIYVWGASLTKAADAAKPYQRITDGVVDYFAVQPQPVLFQDSAGTVPVTAVEQPVGLMLDKSQGLVLGSELVTNGDFSNGSTGWSLGVAVVSGGKMSFSAAGLYAELATQAGIVASGKTYRLTFEVSGLTSGSFNIGFATSYGGTITTGRTISANGTYSWSMPSSGTGLYLISMTAGTTASIDNISVKELAGNHAFQATSASRPVLSARYNQFISTENLSVNWNLLAQGTGAVPIRTPNAGVDPLGGNNATRLQLSRTGTTTVDRCIVWQSISNASTQTNYPATIWLKSYSGATQKIALMPNFGNGEPVEVTVTNAWQSFVVQANTLSSTFARLDIGLGYATSTETSADVLVWGASLVPANQSTLPYQRVNTSTDYNSIGFAPYLRFDGIDDFMVTNNINFTATNKVSLFAGIRKLSNAGQFIAELSANLASNNGTFSLEIFSDAKIYAASRGTVTVDNTPSGVLATTLTTVVTQQTDISAPLVSLRLDGTQVAQNTSNQGIGNYGNYPLYIGRRGGTIYPFNGPLYSLIVVGKTVSSTELSNTEAHVAAKTGFTKPIITGLPTIEVTA